MRSGVPAALEPVRAMLVLAAAFLPIATFVCDEFAHKAEFERRQFDPLAARDELPVLDIQQLLLFDAEFAGDKPGEPGINGPRPRANPQAADVLTSPV